MKLNHTIMHYAIGITALIGVGVAYRHQPEVKMVPTAVTEQVTNVKVSANDWPDLDQDKTIALGEALNTLGEAMEKGGRTRKVTLFCAQVSCINLRKDIDDAFQIGWFQRDFVDDHVDSESQKGLFVGPPGEDAEALSEAIRITTGIEPVIVPISDIDGVGVIIGKAEVK